MPLEKSKRATFYDQFNLTERRKIRVWQIAYRKHPERFVRQPPAPLRLPAAIWINPPPKVVQDPIDGPSAEKTSRIFDPQAICFACARCFGWARSAGNRRNSVGRHTKFDRPVVSKSLTRSASQFAGASQHVLDQARVQDSWVLVR
jgi:hypothetical protein